MFETKQQLFEYLEQSVPLSVERATDYFWNELKAGLVTEDQLHQLFGGR